MEHTNPESLTPLPNAADAEKSILSTFMQDPEDFIPLGIEAGLKPEWFYIPAHRVIWNILLEFYQKEIPVELVSFTQTLKDRDILTNIGGAGELTHIYTFAPTSAHFEHHLGQVKDKAFRRKVLEWTRRTSEAAYSDDDLTGHLGQPVEELLEATQKTTIVTGREAARQWLVDWAEKVENGGGNDLISPSGIPTIDRIRGGIDAPGLTYVGALPSMGKTAFLLQMIAHKLTQTDERVLMFSLEMTAKQLMQRLIMHLCKFQNPDVVSGKAAPTKDDLHRIREKAKLLASDRFLIEEGSGLSIEQIEARAKLEARKGGISLIGVDYVQLVQSQSTEGVEQRMTAVTHGLQRMMKTHQASVIGLSQLTVDDSGNAKLKYARSMEEDADLSLRLLGDEEEKRLTGIRVTKDRHAGQVGWYPNARFNKMTQTFIEERYSD